MAFQVRGLRNGDVVTGVFHGDKGLGNEPYTLKNLSVLDVNLDDGRVKFAEDDSTFTFEIYKFNGRWTYGSSASRFSIADKVSVS